MIGYSGSQIIGEFGGYHWTVFDRCNNVSMFAAFGIRQHPSRNLRVADGSRHRLVRRVQRVRLPAQRQHVHGGRDRAPATGLDVSFSVGGPFRSPTTATSSPTRPVSAASTAHLRERECLDPGQSAGHPHTTQLISRTATGGGSSGQSYGPSISGDGNLVAFYSFASDLAVGAQPAGQYFVAVFDRSTATMRLVANDADEPDISRDGRHIAYSLNFGEIGDVYVATSTSPQPFATIATDLVSYSTAGPPNTSQGSASSPAISEHGRGWPSTRTRGLLTMTRASPRGHVYVGSDRAWPR